ncbi:MAG: hypothetical protein V7L04_07740 [Nostoc sp.]
MKEITKTIKNFLKRSTDLEKDSYALDAKAKENASLSQLCLKSQLATQ